MGGLSAPRVAVGVLSGDRGGDHVRVPIWGSWRIRSARLSPAITIKPVLRLRPIHQRPSVCSYGTQS